MNFAYLGYFGDISAFSQCVRAKSSWVVACVTQTCLFRESPSVSHHRESPRAHNDRHESTLEEEGSRGAKSVERKLGRDARGFGRVFEGRSARQCARSSLGKGVPRSLGVQRKLPAG